MKTKSRFEQSGRKFRWLQIEILVVFAAIIMIVIFLLDYVILNNTKQAMESNASNLIAANSRQIQLNINSYLQRMETVPTLLFSDESYYLYDATDENMEEYDKVKCEETIQNRITDIGLMENYSDFGIVYADDHVVGWISHGTEDIFPDGGMYEAFSGYITDSKKSDGWAFDINGCTDRIYYVKRLNENAILESATYTRELSSVFVYPEQLEEMTIRLVDQENEIIYSSDLNEIGKVIPAELLNELSLNDSNSADSSGDINKSVISEKYLINTNECVNGWRVICSVPTKIILKDNNQMRRFTLKLSMGVAMFFLLVGLEFLMRIYRPMDVVVESLKEGAEIDSLSGVRNKASFQDAVDSRLGVVGENDISILVMIDVDNFKQINDKLGHAHGDQVIIRTGKLLKKMYDADYIIGRLGGDEFASFSVCVLSDSDMDETKYNEYRDGIIATVSQQLESLQEEFNKEFEEEKSTCNISLSAGVYVSEKSTGEKEKFKIIYEKADSALYESKNAGKSRYTIYKES